MSVERILALGEDQLAAQYVISFPEGLPNGGNSDNLMLRLDQSFDPPEEMVGDYDIRYRGMLVKKTNMTEATEKSFSVDVRIDQNWEIIKDLQQCKEMTYNALTGTAMSEEETRFTMQINAMDQNNNIVASMQYNYCKVKGLKIGTFDNASEDPLRATITFIYGSYELVIS